MKAPIEMKMIRLRHILLIMLTWSFSMKLQSQCTANFTWTITGANVSFSSTSTGTGTNTLYQWNFMFPNSSTTLSAIASPTANFTYSANGIYTVYLNITHSSVPTCSSAVIQTITITNACNLTFTATPASGTLCNGSAGLVSNSVMCGGAFTYTWVPGFYTTSSASNICAGTYTILATSSASGSNCCGTASGTITVPTTTVPPCLLSAGSSYTQGANGTVIMMNQSSGTVASTTYTWNFGNAISNSVSPAHSYSANGVYNITLTASNNSTPACISSTVITVTVTTVPVNTCNASFIYSVHPSGLVTFTSTSSSSSSTASLHWNFGPASFSSSTSNTAAYSYTTAGSYTVVLTLNTIPACTSSFVAVVNVPSVTPCGLTAGFTYSLGNNGSVSFTNTSTGTLTGTTYSWTFSDGGTSTSASPVRSFTTNGTYTAVLVATNGSFCTSSHSDSVVVTTNCPLNAAFVYSVTGSQVSFSSTSTGTQTGFYYTWNFGNGNLLTTQQSTAMQSYNTGTFLVVLTVSSNSTGASCTRFAWDTVIVASCGINAGLTHTVGQNGIVAFSDNSTGSITNYFWNFGDGTTSTQQNPVHTYVNGGTHYLKHYVSSGFFCSDTVYQAINITNVSCNANSGFTLIPSNTPQHWFAIPSYPWNVSAAVWSWGDGSTSTGLYSSHQYSAAGNYQICLSVTVSCAGSSSTCTTYSVFRGSTASQIIYVNVIAPATTIENISEASDRIEMSLFPNPTGGNLTVVLQDGLSGPVHLIVTNAMGQLVQTIAKERYESPINLDLTELSPGIYFIRAQTGRASSTGKIILDGER